MTAKAMTAKAMTDVLRLDHVGKRFAVGERELAVLDDVSFSVAAGESVAITGPSGSGKSTLVGLIAGLDEPSSGRVIVAGQDLGALRPGRLAAFRGQHIGIVFQSYRLLPTLSAEENVRVPLELAGRTDAAATARRWLERVGLGERLTHLPSRLSGGEQQRVAVARALAVAPALLIADEPTGNLDRATGIAIADLLFALVREHGSTLLLVTHDAALAARTARRIDLLDGRVVSDNRSNAGHDSVP